MGSRLGAKNTQVKQGKCSALAAKQQKGSRMHIYHTRKNGANYSTLYKRAKEGQLPLTFFCVFQGFFPLTFFWETQIWDRKVLHFSTIVFLPKLC